MKPDSEDSTLAYYEQQGQAFFEGTAYIDMSAFYSAFLELLPKNGHILDLGCGSGRDSKAFLARGYQVSAVDASPKMVEMASQFIGQAVLLQDARTLEYLDAFDGIWACASLLHVSESELPGVFESLGRALKPNGVIYASFKLGKGERSVEGRRFTDMDEDALVDCLGSVCSVIKHTAWISEDRRPERSEKWLNTILQKSV